MFVRGELLTMCDNDSRRIDTGMEFGASEPEEFGSASADATRRPEPAHAPLLASVLILEDNFVIGMDASDMLRELGAQRVTTVSTAAEALRALDEGHVTFALLDVNLFQGNSSAVARQCEERKIRAVLATAFGDDVEAIADFPVMPVLHKPYNKELIERLIEDWGLALGVQR